MTLRAIRLAPWLVGSKAILGNKRGCQQPRFLQTESIMYTSVASVGANNTVEYMAKAPGTVRPGKTQDDGRQLREAFDAFAGEVFFGQMLKSMRKTLGKPPYFHGGRAEEVFQQQLDQVLAEKLSKASAEKFTGPMFELFTLPRT